jgi:hypothetical protein
MAKKNLLLLPGIEPRLLGRSAPSLVVMQTELSRIYHQCVNAGNMFKIQFVNHIMMA